MSVAEINLLVEGVEIVCDVLVARELAITTDLILGTDWLTCHRAVLNFDDNSLTFDENVVTNLLVKSDTNDLMSLVDLTKLEPGKLTTVRVKVPSRFNNKLIMATSLKPICDGSIIVESTVNRPEKCRTHIMLINLSNDVIHLCKDMNIAACEIIDEADLMTLYDLQTDSQSDVRNVERECIQTGHSLNVHAKPFSPTNEIKLELMTPSRECKITTLEKLGLNLSECKLSQDKMDLLVDILYEYREVFDIENPSKDTIPNYSYRIPLRDPEPVWTRNYRVRADVQAELEKHVKKLLKDGVIERGTSPYNSPILCLKKPNGTTRFLLDCRKINERIVTNFNYLHDAQEVIQKVMQYRAKMYSTFDLKEAFFSLNLDKASRPITGFSLASGGTYNFCRLPMGLKSSPSVFCRIMNQIFKGTDDFLQCFLDDILLADKNEDAHLEHIKMTLQRVRENNLRINARKTHLFVEKVCFLGFVLSKDGGCETQPDKIKTILALKPPKDTHQLRSVIGAMSYYRRFCPSFSKIVSPLTRLLRKGVPFVFDSECMEAFKKLIDLFKHPQILRPFEISQPIYIQTDASLTSIASVIMQKDTKTGKFFLIDSAGRGLKQAEKHYTISCIEALSIIFSLQAYKQYLSLTSEIHVLTDHVSLAYYNSIRNTAGGGRLARWSLILSEYNIKIHHLAGKFNYLPDLLSRQEIGEEIATDVDESQIEETILSISEGLERTTAPSAEYFDTCLTDRRDSSKLDFKTDEILLATEVGTNRLSDSKLETDILKRPLVDRLKYATKTKPSNDLKQEMHLTTDEIQYIAKTIAEIDELSLVGGQYSEKVLNNGTFQLTPINDSSDSEFPMSYWKSNTPIFTAADYDIACQNILLPFDPSDVRDATDTSATNYSDHFQLSPIQTDNNYNETNALTSDDKIVEDMQTDEALETPVNYNQGDLKTDQMLDRYIAGIRYVIENNILSNDPVEARRIIMESDNFFIENDLLFRWKQTRARRPENSNNFAKQLVIPQTRVKDLIKCAHDQGGHFSAEYTYAKLANWSWWPKQYGQIQEYCASCLECQRGKGGASPAKPPLQHTEEFDQPFKGWMIDFLKLSVTPRGNQYLFVIICKASHLCILIPTKDQAAQTVAQELYKNVICEWGAFTHLFHDRAANFMGKVMAHLTQSFGIKQICSSSRHPCSQGLVERVNRTLLGIFRTLPNSENLWDLYVPSISYALRCTPSKSLGGFTPFQVATGRNMLTVEQHNAEPLGREKSFPLEDQMIDLQEKLSLTQKLVKEGRDRYLKSMASTFNRNAKLQTFVLGQKVLLKRECFALQKTPKLFQRFMGPYEIIEKNDSFNTYKLKDVATGKSLPNFIHVCKLKTYISRETSQTSMPSAATSAATTAAASFVHAATPNAAAANASASNLTDLAQSTSNSEATAIGNNTSDYIPTQGSDKIGEAGDPLPLTSEPKARRSLRIQEKVERIGGGGMTYPSGRRFYGSTSVPGLTNADPKIAPEKSKKICSILKLKSGPEPSSIITRFAKFKVPGRPKDGGTRMIKIKIIRVIHARKAHGSLEFYVELESSFKNGKLAWVSEHYLDPPLEGVRAKRFPFVDRPYSLR